jgi:prepilin-type N-terminal cleavage/methylation domain-containing protein
MRSGGRDAGFSLAELLVTMAIASVMGLAGVGYYRGQTRALTIHSATLDATEKLRAGMALITREIRLAGYDPTATAMVVVGQKGIVDARGDFLWIRFDRNGDGTIDTNAADPDAESIVFSYDAANQQILRTVAGVSQPLVKNVPSGTFSFQYFDILGNAMTMGTVAFTSPSGLPTSVAASAASEPAVSAAQRDLIALVRVSLQVQTVGLTPALTLPLSARVTVPARTVDRL